MTLPVSAAIWTIVVAAGTGSRFGGETPKQFIEIAGRRIVDWSTSAAAAASEGVVVVLPSSGDHAGPLGGFDAEIRTATGGATRSDSVRAGLALVPSDAAVVMVHDAARPLATPGLFERVAAAVLEGADGAIPVVSVVDTLRHVAGHPVDRSELLAVQTPQGFTRAALVDAHGTDSQATDDATLVTRSGGEVVTVPGERWNLKVTDPVDEIVAAAVLRSRPSYRSA